MAKHEAHTFGTKELTTFIVVDDRWAKDATYSLNCDNQKIRLYDKKKENYKWAPKVVIPCSERYTPEESKKLGDAIAEFLDADWVKQKLEGN